MIKRQKWLLVAVVGIFSLLFAAIFGISILKFNQYRASVVPIYPASGHPQVSITSPAQNSQFSLGAPIIVQASAFSSQDIFGMELYSDGELVGVESAPSGGTDNFSADFLWSPPETGEYTLIARGIGLNQLTSYSSPIQIKITDAEYDPKAQDTTDYALPSSMDSSNPPTAPDGQGTPAEDWNGTPGDWINSLTTNAPPNAPELAVSLDRCSVLLSIHDLSDNEEGFEVWRLLPNSPSWSSVDVLASQSQHEWITYTDNDAHGLTTYFVSAFNTIGVQDSNLVSVNVDPVDCPPPSTERSALTLKLESLETLIPVDKLYCYFSLDGVHWMRRPEFGFWPGGDALQEPGSFNTKIISLNLPADDGSLEPEIKPVNFYLDCWGWQADTLHYLGALSPSLVPNQPGSNQFGSDGFLAEISLIVKELPDQLEFYPMGGAGEDDYEFGVSEDEIQVLPSWLESTIDPTMPILYPYVTYDPDQCKSHLPPPFQNSFGQFLFCTPYPGFDLGDEGVNPQPYFVWNPLNKCIEGTGDPPCKHYPYWISFAADLGHEVGFNIYDKNNKGFYIHHVNAPELFNFVIPVVPCSGWREFWVQMWYYDGSSFLPTYGPPSYKFPIKCPSKLGTKMLLDIHFDAIKFSNIDDGESAPQDVEVYGYLNARSETQSTFLNFAPWNQSQYGCPDEVVFGELYTGGALGLPCPKRFTNGIYDLADVFLSQSDSYKPDKWKEDYKTNNNTIRLTIEEYDSLTLRVKIVDWDDGSANDLVCQGIFQIPSQSIYEWYKVKNQKFAITGSLTGSGSCQIKGMMNALGP